MTEHPTYACGHPRTPENSLGQVRQACRTCDRARKLAIRSTVPPEDLYLERRVRYLPAAIERTRRKLALLEAEACRYRMHDLVSPGGASAR